MIFDKNEKNLKHLKKDKFHRFSKKSQIFEKILIFEIFFKILKVIFFEIH